MISDPYRLDSHKLDLHPLQVAGWYTGFDIYPIYLEISPSGACNHRCQFCSFDFMKYQDRFLDIQIFKERISRFSDLGIKSIQYAGEGEPLLHPDIATFVGHTATTGIDVGISTNGVYLTEKLCAELLPFCTWIKVSFNAGSRKKYAEINGCNPTDFDTVIKNLAYASSFNSRSGHLCTLGIQMVVLPENESEMFSLALLAKTLSLDYVVFKPYVHNPHTRSERYKDLDQIQFSRLDEIQSLQSDAFKVEIRENAFRKSVKNDRPYGQCLALPFWAYIDSGGEVWGCYRHIGERRFYYGNIYQSSFEQIWEGDLRRDLIRKKFDISECGIGCRMDEINRYLLRLRNPERHDNFI